MVVAGIGSLIVGYALIVVGFVGIAGGIGVATLKAVRDALSAATAPGTRGGAPLGFEVPWDKIFDLLKELLKKEAGVPFVMGLFAVAAGITVISYDPF